MDTIHLSLANITDIEEAAVLRALRSGWVAPLGPEVDAFEAEVAARVGVKHALAINSGTAALHLALMGVGVRPGSKVLVPSMTFAATANAVVHAGGEPVFVDSVATDGNVDPSLMLQAADTLASEGTPAVAAVTVDLFGRCADYEALEEALIERGVALVEDAAEALGATRQGRAAGSFGDVAALSFNGNKIMTTSGGGMLLSNSSDLVEHARYLSTQARQPVPWYEHIDIGYNYRMSNLLAALGRAQLSRLDAMISRRREIRDRYAAGLSDLNGVRLIGRGVDPDDSEDNCWLTSVILDDALIPQGVNPVIAALSENQIEARHLWKPMHAQPVFSKNHSFTTGVSDDLFARGLNLPSGVGLTDDDVDRVLSQLRRALREAA